MNQHKKTPESAKLVETLASLNVSQESIATRVGCTAKTLRARYRHELATGKANNEVSAAKVAYEVAVKDRDPGMLRWWLSVVAGWREPPQAVEVYTPGGKALVVKDDRQDSLSAYFRSQEAVARAAVPAGTRGVERDRPEKDEPAGDEGSRPG